MTDKKKKGFRTISEQEQKEYQVKLYEHRMAVLKRTMIVVAVVFVLVGAVALYMSLRQYTDYDVRASVERADTKGTQFREFGGNILKYSNDGALYADHGNEMIWNQTYEMANPTVDICGNYVTIYDKNGTDIYIMNQKGVVGGIETNYPITQVSIAGQGTIAVLMDNRSVGRLVLYDKEGNELVNGAIHGEKGGYPIAIALSDDAIKLGVSMLDTNQGRIKTTLAFYNFGAVGENSIDHIVSMNSYEDMLIPELDFVSADCMIAMADAEIKIFEGTQTPKESKSIPLTDEAKSIFYNEKYVGIVYNGTDEALRHHLQVYDTAGKLKMEEDFTMEYTDIGFLDGDEVVITNRSVCDIFTIQGIYKFHYEFEDELYHVLSGGSSLNYTFILNGKTEQARLK